MEAQVFTFEVDTDTHKLVAVQHHGRSIDVTVRYASDASLDETRTRIRNVIEPRFRTDDRGLVVEWRLPFVPGVAWPTMVRQRRLLQLVGFLRPLDVGREPLLLRHIAQGLAVCRPRLPVDRGIRQLRPVRSGQELVPTASHLRRGLLWWNRRRKRFPVPDITLLNIGRYLHDLLDDITVKQLFQLLLRRVAPDLVGNAVLDED